VRLTKSIEEYLETRERRRELSYEAMLGAGRRTWNLGERVRVYRATGARAALYVEPEGDDAEARDVMTDLARSRDARDYDVEYYVRLLHDTYAARLERALDPEDFAATFADPEQLSLFSARLEDAKPILTVLPTADGTIP
jgi:hypothetical protein